MKGGILGQTPSMETSGTSPILGVGLSRRFWVGYAVKLKFIGTVPSQCYTPPPCSQLKKTRRQSCKKGAVGDQHNKRNLSQKKIFEIYTTFFKGGNVHETVNGVTVYASSLWQTRGQTNRRIDGRTDRRTDG